MKKEAEKNQTTKLILAGIVFAIILVSIFVDMDEKEEISNLPYSEMLLPQKKAYLIDFIKEVSDENMMLQVQSENYIRKQFKYPEEVEFIDKPILYNSKILSIDSGYVQLKGYLTAKNAFGVKAKHEYNVKYKVTTQDKKIMNISID